MSQISYFWLFVKSTPCLILVETLSSNQKCWVFIYLNIFFYIHSTSKCSHICLFCFISTASDWRYSTHFLLYLFMVSYMQENLFSLFKKVFKGKNILYSTATVVSNFIEPHVKSVPRNMEAEMFQQNLLPQQILICSQVNRWWVSFYFLLYYYFFFYGVGGFFPVIQLIHYDSL